MNKQVQMVIIMLITLKKIYFYIGDIEIYSGSKNKETDFSNQGRFFNRDMVSDYVHKNVTYESYMHETQIKVEELWVKHDTS